MLRGFRWQFIAFVLAIVLFVIGLAYRSSIQPTPQPTSPPIAETATLEQPTATPTTEVIPTVESTQSEVILSQDAPTAEHSNTFREGLVGNISRLNPIFAHVNPVDNDLSSLIFEGLMKTNEFGEPVYNLAQNLVISNSGLEYVFTLRNDVLWQDGVPFTADDVVYTMSLLSSPDYEKYSPTAKFWQTVETQKLADNLVRFRLTQPLGSFTTFLTIGLLPEHALRGTEVEQLVDHPFNLTPIGTGAYQLGALHSSNGQTIDQVTLQLAPVFTGRAAGQSGYVYRELEFYLFDDNISALEAYRSGDIDAVANASTRSELMFLPDSRIYTQVQSSVTMLIFNWNDGDDPIFAERRVRQSLSLGLNQQEIMDRHLAAEASFADSPLILGSWAYQPNPLWTTFDQTQAQSVLATADLQAPDSVSGTEDQSATNSFVFSFSIMVPDDDPLPALAVDIAAQWGQLGFDVSIDRVHHETFQDRLKSGEFQTAIVSLPVGADPDVYRYWHPGQAEDGLNYGGASNDEVAELLERGRQDRNGINRTTVYHDFQKRFAEQAIAIPLYYPLYTYVVRDTIDGVRLGFLGTPADRFRTISDWHPITQTS